MKIGVGIAALVLLVRFAAADSADRRAKDRDSLPLPPDGVKYLNRDS